MAPSSRPIRFKLLTVWWAPHIRFVPRCAFLSPIPISAVTSSLRFLFYTIVESSAICHFPQQFFEPLWLNLIFLLFPTVAPSPPPWWLSLMVTPVHPGASFISHLPFLVLHGSLLSSVGFCLFVWGFFVLFFSLDFKIPSTAKALPPCVPSVFCVL